MDSDNSSAAEEVTFIMQLTVQTMQLPIIDRKCPCKACDDNKSDATQTISLTFYFKTPILYWDSLCVDMYVGTMYSSGGQETVVPVLVITAQRSPWQPPAAVPGAHPSRTPLSPSCNQASVVLPML